MLIPVNRKRHNPSLSNQPRFSQDRCRTKTRLALLLIVAIFSYQNCQSIPETNAIIGEDVTTSDAKPSSFQKIAPLTTNAFGARKVLHEEGFWVVPSTRKSLNQVEKEGRMSALTAKALVFEKLPGNLQSYPKRLQTQILEIRALSQEQRRELLENGTELHKGTNRLVKQEWNLSKSYGVKAYSSFVLGYVEFGERNKESRQRLQKGLQLLKAPTDIPEEDRIQSVWKSNSEKITTTWRKGLLQSTQEFQKHLEESGNERNTLLALVDVFRGYALAIKKGFFSPTISTVTEGSEMMVVDGVAIPMQTAVVTWKNLVLGTGLVMVYPLESGYQVVSPSFEAGLFSSLSLLSAMSTVPTAIGGNGLYGFHQLTVVTTIPVIEGGVQTVGMAKETGTVFAGMTYDFAKETSKTVYYGSKAGVILGTSALLAIPTHLLLSVPDGIVLLAYDGPRVVIAVVRGNYTGYEELPPGTVLNTEELRKSGAKIQILTDDPKIVNKVLEGQKKDMK